jgi:hypothetical protein
MSDGEHDYESLLWAESADLASLMDELDGSGVRRMSSPHNRKWR